MINELGLSGIIFRTMLKITKDIVSKLNENITLHMMCSESPDFVRMMPSPYANTTPIMTKS